MEDGLAGMIHQSSNMYYALVPSSSHRKFITSRLDNTLDRIYMVLIVGWKKKKVYLLKSVDRPRRESSTFSEYCNMNVILSFFGREVNDSKVAYFYKSCGTVVVFRLFF
jgi:hypothetical protein